MDILFIDSNENIEKINKKNKFGYLNFGFYINKLALNKEQNENLKEQNIYYLNINTQKLVIRNKVLNKILDITIKNIFKKRKVYIVLSKYVESKELLNRIRLIIENPFFVTEQNNLLKNDVIYMDEYIKNKKMTRKDVKILFVIDVLSNDIKVKIESFLKIYKTVDIYATKNIVNLREYVENLNNTLGSTTELLIKLDRMTYAYYNIFLVFSKNYNAKILNNSFVLDYNNSELDVRSNVYLIFKNNIRYFEYVFLNLDMDISRFDKTKLGKLYMHLE